MKLEDILKLPPETKQEVIRLLQQKQKLQNNKDFTKYYPDDGPLRRDLYLKHLEFFAAGAQFRERAVISGNRIGKSLGIGGYETTLHLTGLYCGLPK